MKGRSLIVVLAVWGLVAWGCGYHLQGANDPDATIEVPIFENRTIETGIEALITDILLDELRRMPGWRIVAPGQGHYALQGTVEEFTSEPHIISPTRHLGVEHRARLTLSVKFRDRKSGKALWTTPNLHSFEDYPVGSEVLVNEREKYFAIARIAEELATRIRVHIQDTW